MGFGFGLVAELLTIIRLENIEFLNSLPNKEKLTSLNFFGNQIQELDLAWLLKTFPNLKKINGGNNPLRAKNLQNLTSEQFSKLVEKMKDKSIQINSYKSMILMDLLEYTQGLIKSGDSSQRQQAQELQAIIQNSQVKNEQKPNNSKTPWLIGGGVLVGLALVAGYLVGKKKKNNYE